MEATGVAGNFGDRAASDCRISITLRDDLDRPTLSVESGASPNSSGTDYSELCARMCAFFGVSGAAITVEDYEAPAWVAAARWEAALKQADPARVGAFFPEGEVWSFPPSRPDRCRRSRLYVPGDCPRFMRKAEDAGADGVIFDLEDAVAPARKAAARILVRNALRYLDLGTAERMVRINPFPMGREDLAAVASQGVHVVLLPKCESPRQVCQAADALRHSDSASGREGAPFLLPIIESALGVERAFDICTAAPEVIAVTLGLEDYTADLCVRRTPEGQESLWARQRLVNAAAAAGVQALDSVFSDFRDRAALENSIRESRALGYVGKGCIHPSQVPVVNEGFTPTSAEIERARRVVKAYEEAEARGLGAVALDGKMIDPPVVKRAVAILAHARWNGVPD